MKKKAAAKKKVSTKRKVAAGVAITVAVASIATNLLVEPEELLHSAQYLQTHTQYMEQDQQEEFAIEYTELEEPTRVDALRSWLVSLPVAIKAMILLPLWALGAIPVALGTAVFSALAPIWMQVVSFLLQAGILAGLFCLVYKLIFPNRSIKELFKKKNLRWLILGAVTMTMVNFLLAQVWVGWPIVRVVLLVVAGFGVLCLLWHRICNKLRPPEPGIIHNRLTLEFD
jgi:hypothetical protein